MKQVYVIQSRKTHDHSFHGSIVCIFETLAKADEHLEKMAKELRSIDRYYVKIGVGHYKSNDEELITVAYGVH
jgi:hypothetical protein